MFWTECRRIDSSRFRSLGYFLRILDDGNATRDQVILAVGVLAVPTADLAGSIGRHVRTSLTPAAAHESLRRQARDL